MKFDTKQASAFSPSCPKTFVRANTSIPDDRLCEDSDEGRHPRYIVALVVTPILTSARRAAGLTSANVDELDSLMQRLQLELPRRTESLEDDEESVGSEALAKAEAMLGRVQCTVYDSKKRQHRSVLRSSRFLDQKLREGIQKHDIDSTAR